MNRYRVVFFLINRLVERLTLTTDKTKNSPQKQHKSRLFFSVWYSRLSLSLLHRKEWLVCFF